MLVRQPISVGEWHRLGLSLQESVVELLRHQHEMSQAKPEATTRYPRYEDL